MDQTNSQGDQPQTDNNDIAADLDALIDEDGSISGSDHPTPAAASMPVNDPAMPVEPGNPPASVEPTTIPPGVPVPDPIPASDTPAIPQPKVDSPTVPVSPTDGGTPPDPMEKFDSKTQ